MKTWKKLALIVVPAILILGIGVRRIQVARNQPVAVQPRNQERPLTQDEMVQPRKLYIDDLKSARDLIGKPVWVQSGYSMDYFPYVSGHVEFKKKTGVLPSAERLEIKDIVEEETPDDVVTRIPKGEKQAFAVFTMPGDEKEYATPIATLQAGDSTWYCDQLFYYDDPRQMYKFWPADVWQAIDQHQPKPGMSELQTAMALGVMQQSQSSNYGNRTVYYTAGDQRWAVTFENDKATSIQRVAGNSKQAGS